MPVSMKNLTLNQKGAFLQNMSEVLMFQNQQVWSYFSTFKKLLIMQEN